jgi:hypothetical protein
MQPPSDSTSRPDLPEEVVVESIQSFTEWVTADVGKVIVSKRQAVEMVLVTVLCEGPS